MFDPNMMPTAEVSVISSAERNEITIMEIRLELCTIAVTIKPVVMALGVVLVNLSKILSSRLPLKDLNPLSIYSIPMRKRAIPPRIMLT
jgi:hypothetical protein